MIDQFEISIELAYLIPENLPIFGVKTRAYYHGMPKQCGKCFALGHIRSECQGEAKTWVQYVTELAGQGIPIEHLGTWVEREGLTNTNRGRGVRGNRGQRGQTGQRGRGAISRNYRQTNRGAARGAARGRGARGRGVRGRGY